jgi:hypothetical protein
MCEFAPARMLVNSILAGAFCRAGIMGAEACRIVLYKILVNKYSACYNMQAYFVYTVKTKRLKCRNTQSGRN